MKKYLLLLALSLLLAACAAPAYNLNFQPQGPLPEEWQRFLGQKVALLKIEDARSGNPGILLYGGSEGRVELSRHPLTALADAFEKQLRFAGFYVVRAESPGEARQAGVYRILKITLERLEVTPKQSWCCQRWTAKLGYRVDILDAQGEPLAVGATFHGERELFGFRRQATVQDALDEVSNKMIKEFLLSAGLQKHL